jgi:hypothetical protein
MIIGSMAPLAPELGGVTIVVFVLVMLVTMVEVLTVEPVRKVVDIETVETMVVTEVVTPRTSGGDMRSIAESSAGDGGLGIGVEAVKDRLEPTIHPYPGEVK